jgi:hypothetical protein
MALNAWSLNNTVEAKLHWRNSDRLTASRSGAAGVAFEAGAIVDQGEVAGFGAAVALIAFDAGGAGAFEAELGCVVPRLGFGRSTRC